VEPFKTLFARWSDRVHFLDVLIRQAHPGPDWPAYHAFEEKLHDAKRYVEQEGTPWPVLVDGVEGTTHQTYGGMTDPVYLIGCDGRVSYYQLWAYAPNLHEAIEALLERGGCGVVNGGLDQIPHFGPALTNGWRGIQRALPRSFVEMELAAPGSATAVAAGRLLKPVVGTLTLRSKPLSPQAKVGLAIGAAGLAFLGARALMKRRSES
jgi:hypothetical protein